MHVFQATPRLIPEAEPALRAARFALDALAVQGASALPLLAERGASGHDAASWRSA
jgi:hypothetical protein